MTADWKKANVISNLRKEHTENGRLARLNLTPRKMVEQLILETTSTCLEDWKVIRNNQHEFTKEKLINFCDEMTGLVEQWESRGEGLPKLQ